VPERFSNFRWFFVRALEEGVKHASECWASRLNCAESVLRGVCFAQGIDLADQGRRMATPFREGIGRSEDICGALAGGVLAIGAALGRTSAQEDRLKSYEAAARLQQAFQSRLGSTCCKVLNNGTSSRLSTGRAVGDMSTRRRDSPSQSFEEDENLW